MTGHPSLQQRPDRSKLFRLGARLRLADLSREPYPILAQLRAEEPVSWAGEVGMWFVTRRDDIVRVLKDPDTFTTAFEESPIRDVFGPQMLSTEGAVARGYKRKCTPPFTTVSVHANAAGLIEAKANALIDGFTANGRADLRPAFASPLVVHAVTEILGLRGADQPTVLSWYADFAEALANFTGDAEVRRRGLRAADAFRERVRPRLGELRERPDSSLLGALAGVAHDPLTDEEILSNALLILFGGIETAESMILNVIWALLSHPEQLASIRDDTDRLAAVEESLRWEPAVQTLTRRVTRAVTLRGVELAEGDVVQCMIAAANRDPAHFEDPERFDIQRPNAGDHFTFGHGSHFCLGAPLARLEGQISLRLLFDRLPCLRLDPDRPSAPFGYEFRKPPELWVRWGKDVEGGSRV